MEVNRQRLGRKEGRLDWQMKNPGGQIKIGKVIHYIAGFFIAFLFMFVAPILSILVVVGSLISNDLDSNVVALVWAIGFILLGSLAYTNLLFFFSRLRKEDATIFNRATKNLAFVASICSRDGAWRLHQWVKKISLNANRLFSKSLVNHAKITRYLNLSWLLALLLLVLFPLLWK